MADQQQSGGSGSGGSGQSSGDTTEGEARDVSEEEKKK